MKRIIDTENTNIIGPRIKEARSRAGMSQKELSEKLELMAVYTCRGSISRIENGVIIPSVGIFYRIINALGMRVEIVKPII